jgi:hypothetical protein
LICQDGLDKDVIQIGRKTAKLTTGPGGVSMRCAIWLPAGKIVFVRSYDASNNVAIIEHDNGKLDRVAATAIHLLESPVDLEAAIKSGDR